MSQTAEAIVLAVFVLATSIWIGGYIAIAVVARAAATALDPPARVAFFRSLGRMYFWVGTPALVIALATGWVLARNVDTGGLFVSIVVVAAVLLVAFGFAVAQARRMTRLRRGLATEPGNAALAAGVAREARAAGVLRGVLGILSIALVVQGAFLAVR